MSAKQALLGFKGYQILDVGYIYAPYIPLHVCPTINLSQMNETLIFKFEIEEYRFELHLFKEFDYSAPDEPIFCLKYSSFPPKENKWISDHLMSDIPYFPMRPVLHQNMQFLPFPDQIHQKCLEALKKISNG